MPDSTPRCPACHQPIPSGAPGGLCPACVLRGADEPPPPPGLPAAPPLVEIAAAFPQWEIVGLIGQGGMGSVYQVRQPQLDRFAALKILSPSLGGDPAFAERFNREARALGALNHPNIVTLYEHGQAGGFFYLLMEYVDGVNLRQAMQAGRFTPEQALALVPPLCDALQAAHAQGVWHRDIKPENILLDIRGRVKIADFGIARITGDPARNFTLTGHGDGLGSTAYVAPEQIEKHHSVDHRADIYSLGVVIYEMLTGELPLGRFRAPSRFASVDARIDEIVLRTLEKERELRQQSAAEVKTAVSTAGARSASAAGTLGSPFGSKLISDMAVALIVPVCGILMFIAIRRQEPNAPTTFPFNINPLAAVLVIAVAAFLCVVLFGRRTSHAPQAERSENGATPSRFSRRAIAGACLIGLGMLSGVVSQAVDRAAASSTNPANALLAAATVYFFVAMILGCIAVSEIRRSAGKLHGLGLAVFDGLFFPLLILNFVLTLFFHQLGIAFGWWTQTYDVRSDAALIVWSCLSWPFVDILIIRQVWRAVSRTHESSPQPSSTNSPASKLSEAHGWISAVLVLTSLAGAALLLFDGHTIWKNHTARQWPVTEGLIVSSQTFLQDASLGKPGNAKVPRADVRYSYSVDGRSYESSNVSFGRRIGGRNSPAAVDDAVRYPRGTKVRVAYNPADPAEAVLDVSSDPHGWLALGFLLSATFPVWRMARTAVDLSPRASKGRSSRALWIGAAAMVVIAVSIWLAAPKHPDYVLSGSVIDSESGLPIPEAIVAVTRDGETVRRTQADRRGTYTLRWPGDADLLHWRNGVRHSTEMVITASAAGYETSSVGTLQIPSTGYAKRAYDFSLPPLSESNEFKPVSAEAVEAYREFYAFLHSRQPRELVDPDAAKKMGELRTRFFDSLRGTKAGPLLDRVIREDENQRRAYAKGDEAESKRLQQEVKRLSRELGQLMTENGAPDFDEPDASQSPGKAAAVATGAMFGPVHERVIEPTNPERRALNLAFGNFISPGPGRNLNFSDQGRESLRAAGVDLFAPDVSSGGFVSVLTALDMRLCVDINPTNPEDFDNLTTRQLGHVVAHMENWRETMEAVSIPGSELVFRNATSAITKNSLYVFVTRNDVKGALQISDDLRGVKVRYKLVEPAAAK